MSIELVDKKHWHLARAQPGKEMLFFEFLSARGMKPYLSIRESVEIIFGTYSYAKAQQLESIIGPYVLTDNISRRLSQQGLTLLPGNQLPFASVDCYLREELLERAYQKLFQVDDLQSFFEKSRMELLKVYVAEKSISPFESIRRVKRKSLTCWQELELLDALECHRNPQFLLEARYLP